MSHIVWVQNLKSDIDSIALFNDEIIDYLNHLNKQQHIRHRTYSSIIGQISQTFEAIVYNNYRLKIGDEF